MVYFVRGARNRNQEIDVTARQRVIKALEEHPDGLSKSQLREIINGNAGAFRRLIQDMLDKEEITVTEEYRPTCGLTKVHTLA